MSSQWSSSSFCGFWCRVGSSRTLGSLLPHVSLLHVAKMQLWRAIFFLQEWPQSRIVRQEEKERVARVKEIR